MVALGRGRFLADMTNLTFARKKCSILVLLTVKDLQKLLLILKF